MKITLAALAAAAFLLLRPGSPAAQVFYQYPDGDVLNAGEFVVGSNFTVGDHELFRFGGFARMNATKYFDVGFELLFDTLDGDERYGFGGDLRFALFPETNAIPFDLSLATGIGMIRSDDVRIAQIPLGAVISSPFRLDTGNVLVPYLGVYVLFIDTEIKRAHARNISDTDLDVEIRAGLRYSLSEGPDLFVGFHLGRDTLVTVGMNFWLKRGGPR